MRIFIYTLCLFLASCAGYQVPTDYQLSPTGESGLVVIGFSGHNPGRVYFTADEGNERSFVAGTEHARLDGPVKKKGIINYATIRFSAGSYFLSHWRSSDGLGRPSDVFDPRPRRGGSKIYCPRTTIGFDVPAGQVIYLGDYKFEQNLDLREIRPSAIGLAEAQKHFDQFKKSPFKIIPVKPRKVPGKRVGLGIGILKAC